MNEIGQAEQNYGIKVNDIKDISQELDWVTWKLALPALFYIKILLQELGPCSAQIVKKCS